MSAPVSVLLTPESVTDSTIVDAAEIVSFITAEPLDAAQRRIAESRFAVERVPAEVSKRVIEELESRGIDAIALPSRRVLPLPRRSVVQAITLLTHDLQVKVGSEPVQLAMREFLHAHLGVIPSISRRRRLPDGSVDSVRAEVTFLDLYYRGGASYRIDLERVLFDGDHRLRGLPREQAISELLSEFLGRAKRVGRAILPAGRPIVLGTGSPAWENLRLESLAEFEARSRWWLAVAANGLMPDLARLDELYLESEQGSAAQPMPAAPREQPPGQRFLAEGMEFERRGQLDLARIHYRQAIDAEDSFEARLALIESLVDEDPFESWCECDEAAVAFPEEAVSLVNRYAEEPDIDCDDFLTVRGLRRSLRAQEIGFQSPEDQVSGFLEFHGLRPKLAASSAVGLLEAYGLELGISFPEQHKVLIASYNHFEIYNQGFRFLGVGGDDEAVDLFLFNAPHGWRRWYGSTLEGLVGFGYDYLGNPFFLDSRHEIPPVIRLDADSGEVEPVAASFVEFLGIDLTDPEAVVLRPRLLEMWLERRPALGRTECLSYKNSPVLGGEKSLLNLTTSELGIRLHIAGQVAEQLLQMPDNAKIKGVHVVNTEDLLIEIDWDYA